MAPAAGETKKFKKLEKKGKLHKKLLKFATVQNLSMAKNNSPVTSHQALTKILCLTEKPE